MNLDDGVRIHATDEQLMIRRERKALRNEGALRDGQSMSKRNGQRERAAHARFSLATLRDGSRQPGRTKWQV